MTAKAAFALKLPHSVTNAASRLTAVYGVSLNHFIAVAVAEKIGTLESADVFFEQRAGKAKPSDMRSVLQKARCGKVARMCFKRPLFGLSPSRSKSGLHRAHQ